MPIPSYKISFDDEDAADDIYENIIRLEINEDLKKAASFMLRISISLQVEGEWSDLDDERFDLFKKVTIAFGFGEDDATPYFEGYITHLAPHFDPEEELCYLEVRGMDASCLMNLEEKIETWADTPHSDVASQLFDLYGITPEVATTSAVHAETDSVLIQKHTDIRFLKELAERNGFECYVGMTDDGQVKGFFKPYSLDVSPRPTLAVHFEGETNVQFIDLQVAGNQPLSSSGWHLSLADKELEELPIEDYAVDLLGQDSLSSITRSKVESLCSPKEAAGRVYQADLTNLDGTELEQGLQGRLDRDSWFIKARGTVNSEAYGSLVHARNLIPVKGLGTRYSGNYLVSSVNSILADGHFEQQIELIKNGWGVTGDEPFEAEG
jgi:phage protein D